MQTAPVLFGTRARWVRLGALVAPLLALACGKGSSPGADAGSVGSTFGVPLATPRLGERRRCCGEPRPSGALRGSQGDLARHDSDSTGDPPPDTGLKFLAHCQRSSPVVYGKIFRVGLDKTLADALVAVTRYGDRGFVPAASDTVRVEVKDCVPDKLTYAVTYGQRMDVYNMGERVTYQPYLDGSVRGIMIAAPKGSPVGLFPTGPSPAHYMLRDQLGSGLVANVFLLNYATVDVTGLDGHYEIKNIPVGKARVDALLPVISKSVGQDVDLVEGDNKLDLMLHFDASKDLPQRPQSAPSSEAAPGAPSASAPHN